MANEYLMKKWELWFRFLDRTHSGRLTKENEEREVEALAKLTHLEGERKEETLKTFQSLWNLFIFHDNTDQVTKDQFMEMNSSGFKNDRKKFEENMRSGCIQYFKVFDQSGDGSLTEDEIAVAYKSLELENEGWIKKFFQAFNPVDGKILCNALVEAWVQFLVSEDSSKKDKILESLESYPDL